MVGGDPVERAIQLWRNLSFDLQIVEIDLDAARRIDALKRNRRLRPAGRV